MAESDFIDIRPCRLDRLMVGISVLHRLLLAQGVDLSRYPELEAAADELMTQISAIYERYDN